MNIAKLSWSYLSAKPLSTFLNVVLFTFGIAIIIVLLLFSSQLEQKMSKNAKGIDMVIGAKGSPMQLILCNIYHIDFPTGNINLFEAERLTKNRQIKKAIPLALGDSYKGYRIVGTTPEYLSLYEASVSKGKTWLKSLEAVIGSNVSKRLGLKPGDRFASQHGVSEGGHSHDAHDFEVTGILEANGTVLDNLILTDVPSIWMVHEDVEEDDHSHDEDGVHEHVHHGHGEVLMESRLIPGMSLHKEDSARQVTSMLIEFRSPMGAVMLPRFINEKTNMQAALPAFETARLFSMVGIGVDVVQGFAFIIIFIAGLSVFIALYNSLKERKYDLAIMRSMGATRRKLFLSIILEGIWITVIGSFFGILLGHATIELINNAVPESDQSGITGFVFLQSEIGVLAASFVVGVIAAIIPAVQAFNTDISRTLARG